MTTKALNRIRYLVKFLNEQAALYYKDGNAAITDHEHDMLYKELKALETEFPESVLFNSPTQRPGYLLEGQNGVPHLTPMLSLDNVYNSDELLEWIYRVKGLVGDVKFHCSLKYDGVSVNVVYEDHVRSHAITRGDGAVGELVNMGKLTNIPTKLDARCNRFSVGKAELRCEGIITRKAFEEANEFRRTNGIKPYATPRNAAAGILRSNNTPSTAEPKLYFIPHGFSTTDKTLTTHSEMMAHFGSMGIFPEELPTDRYSLTSSEPKDILAWVSSIESSRDDIPYDIDGAVIRVDGLAACEELGIGVKYPNYAIAVKFKAEEAIAVLKSVSDEVGMSGVITPVANFDAVVIGGVAVSRATLHNYPNIERLGLCSGDTMIVERRADVSPQVVSVVVSARSPKAKPTAVTMPRHCPSCGSVLAFVGKKLFCRNSTLCKEQAERLTLHFGSRGALNIKGLGPSIVKAIGEVYGTANVLKLFELDIAGKQADALEKLIGKVTMRNLIREIEYRCKDVPLGRFLYALGIPDVGVVTANDIANHFKTPKLPEFDVSDLMTIPNVGEATAQSFYNWMVDNALLHELLLKHVNVLPVVEIQGDLTGKTFAGSGTLPTMTREQLENHIKGRGGKFTKTVNGKLTAFIVGVGASPDKVAKAEALKIPIITSTPPIIQ